MGIVMISDEVQEILDNCNKILLMYEGSIIKVIPETSAVTADQMFDFIFNHKAAGVQKWA